MSIVRRAQDVLTNARSLADRVHILETRGAPPVPVTTITSAYTITGADGLIKADASGGAFNVTLPDATLIRGPFTIKRINTGANVTVDTTGGQTIDGAATRVLSAQWATVTVVSDGVNWLTV